MPGAHNEVQINPVTLVDTADIPGGGELHLLQCGDAFSIQFGLDELMGSEVGHTEQALATLACERLGGGDACVLIGGLGMGFTLGAALAALPSDASVVVAELVPKVVMWARGPLAHLFESHLADPRVSVEIGDVHDAIIGSPDRFDAILLDVDNGPDCMIQLANDRLYCNWGLRAAHAALKPNGVLAIWSAYADAAFVARLEAAKFDVAEFSMPANPGKGDRQNTIWLASKLA
ncbi:MAG: spermidine synthase [Sphingomonadaceae bacterium]